MSEKKKRKRSSFTQMALDELAKEGWHADVCERRLTSRVTKDLFGMFDILAFRMHKTMGLQITNYGNHGNHVTAMCKNPLLIEWLAGRERIVGVWSFRKNKAKEWVIRKQWL